MSTTTPNFGWVVPTSTDLVKDGAAAIETLGDSIDASLVDLKGGTTGQVLSKNTNTDMDFTWVTPNDADAIQNTIVDAKGDLITATAADVPARLGVGTNGQVLTADSTTATGIKWATPAGGSLNEQIFTSSGTFTVPSGVTKVWVEVRGGGAGGSGCGYNGSGAAGKGGGAGVAKTEQVTVTSGGSVTVTIGAGGAGADDNATSTSGSATSFGSLTANGGSGVYKYVPGAYGGLNGHGLGGGAGNTGQGNGSAAAANTGAGGGGSGTSNGYVNSTGGAGGSGIVVVRWIA